jgi:tetratricopeptide (TPR) repeat protein
VAEAEVGFKLLDKYAPSVSDKKRAEMARRDLGSAAITMGNLAFRANQPEKGRAAFDRALAIFRKELAANPLSFTARYNLVKVLSEYGDWCLMKLNRPDEALKYFKLAQDQNRALCDSHDVVNVTQTGLALGYYRLGLAAEKAGKTDEAQKYYSRCLDLREIRVREVEESYRWSPNSRLVMDARIDRMLAQARCGRVAEVTKLADDLLRAAASLEPRKARSPQWAAQVRETQAHYQLFAGCGLSVLAGHVGPSDPRYAQFSTKAVESVRLAVANDFSNLWFLENDPDFDTIRPHPGYQAILASLRPKSK